jgi:hypothetical protein
MKSLHHMVVAPVTALLFAAATIMFAVPGRSSFAQSAPAASKLVGTITAVSGSSATLKADNGAVTTVNIPDGIRMVRTAPGQKDLTGATPIQVQDLQVGDRILVRGNASEDGKTVTASAIIAMKQSDIAEKQQREREDWQRRGAGGLVKTIDPTANSVTISTRGTGTMVINTTPTTVVRRYAPDSVKFDDAQPAKLADIKPGDQLRARGAKSEDGTSLAAEEIVAGSFRNIAGELSGVDANSKTITLTDLTTKKPVVVTLTTDAEMHKLAPMMAQMVAARLKGGSPGAPGAPAANGAPASPAGSSSTPPPSTGGTSHGGPPAGMSGPPTGGWRQGGGGQGGGSRGDFEQMIQRSPVIQIADLHKGDAVMIVATQGNTPGAATAITLLAGVEPMLQASASASQNMFSATWNLGGGAASAEAQQ